MLDYATTKAAIVCFTKGLAEKMVEKGIRVNCVAPGPVWTPIYVSSATRERIIQAGTLVNPDRRIYCTVETRFS